MSVKRSNGSDIESSVKRKKLECYFPLEVEAVVIEIGKYMEGEHLLNFKLVCKGIERALHKKKQEPIEITLANYERTIRTPGRHFIKFDDYDECIELGARLEDFKDETKVNRLVLDYCGNSASYYARPMIFLRCFKLSEFKVIRIVSYVIITVDSGYDTLHTLEVYTTGYILIELHREIKHVRLYTTMSVRYVNWPTIEIRVVKGLVEYAKKIPYCASARKIMDLRTETFIALSGNQRDFVPTRTYL